jgi:hypothetical protein
MGKGVVPEDQAEAIAHAFGTAPAAQVSDLRALDDRAAQRGSRTDAALLCRSSAGTGRH